MTFRLPIADSPVRLPAALPQTTFGSGVGGGHGALTSVGTDHGAGDELLRVGDLARETHKTVRALHLYEELGLLQPVERSKGGFRLYAPDAVVRVRWIAKLQDMGFSLPDIQEILRQWERSGSAIDAMRKIQTLYQQKLEAVDQQIERLKQLRGELVASIDYLESCDVCDPVRLITACPRCELHECGAPELVAGLHGHKQP